MALFLLQICSSEWLKMKVANFRYLAVPNWEGVHHLVLPSILLLFDTGVAGASAGQRGSTLVEDVVRREAREMEVVAGEESNVADGGM